jgi:hypothetical protein
MVCTSATTTASRCPPSPGAAGTCRHQREERRSLYAASASPSRRPTSDGEPAKTYTAPLAGLTAHCAPPHSVTTCKRGASDTGAGHVGDETVRRERGGSIGGHGSGMMLDPQYRSPSNTPAASRATLAGNSIMQSVASSSCCSSATAVVAVDAGVADPEATEPGVRAAKGWRRASSTTRLGSCAPLSGESGTARHGPDGLGMPPTPAGSHTRGRLRGGCAGRYGSVTGSVDPHPPCGSDSGMAGRCT